MKFYYISGSINWILKCVIEIFCVDGLPCSLSFDFLFTCLGFLSCSVPFPGVINLPAFPAKILFWECGHTHLICRLGTCYIIQVKLILNNSKALLLYSELQNSPIISRKPLIIVAINKIMSLIHGRYFRSVFLLISSK